MKQRIRVVAMMREGDKFLVLKRAMGRAEGEEKYELLNGKIGFGEQPEESMGRLAFEVFGHRPKGVELADVVTFMGLQGASQVGNLYVVYRLSIGEVVKITTDKYSAFRWVNETELMDLKLDEASRTILTIEWSRQSDSSRDGAGRVGLRNWTGASAKVYVDGGSRGNPGPSGVGYYIVGENGEEIKRGGEFIGFASSRVAEYYAIKEGVEQAIELGLRRVRFMSDSLMAVNQLNGVYSVKNKDLIPIYNDVLKLLEQIENYSFEHVVRGQNREADAEVNKIIKWHVE